jgi:hypothetical protein
MSLYVIELIGAIDLMANNRLLYVLNLNSIV